MTYSKINNILKEIYGSSGITSGWMKLPEEISIIYLNQDANIYINENQIFHFNSTDDSLEISENDSFKKEFDPKGDYPVHIKLQLSDIGGFIATSIAGPYGVYITKRF